MALADLLQEWKNQGKPYEILGDIVEELAFSTVSNFTDSVTANTLVPLTNQNRSKFTTYVPDITKKFLLIEFNLAAANQVGANAGYNWVLMERWNALETTISHIFPTATNSLAFPIQTSHGFNNHEGFLMKGSGGVISLATDNIQEALVTGVNVIEAF